MKRDPITKQEFIQRANRLLREEFQVPVESHLYLCPTTLRPDEWDYQGAYEYRELALEAARAVQGTHLVR